MFEKLKAAVSSLSSVVTARTLSREDIDKALWQFEVSLFESDVAEEVVKALVEKIKAELTGVRIQRRETSADYVRTRLAEVVEEVFTGVGHVDTEARIEEKKASGDPFVAVFLGVNGTGKTTTIAKFANILKKKGYSVVVACADTHRAGAIEQLLEHAQRLSIKAVSQRYGADPAAVARDAVLHARAHNIDVVLIDTSGRMQTSKNLMEEMSKIIRVASPDLKIFVGDALAGNDVVSQAKEFLSYTNFDAAILTKADADVKGGAALSVAYTTGRPVIYIGMGQGYDDLRPFESAKFAKSLFGE